MDTETSFSGHSNDISNECSPYGQPTSPSLSTNCSEYAKLLSFIYAVLLVIIGFLLSISEAVTQNWLGSIPNTAFFTYLLVIATGYLVFLQFYLLVDAGQQLQPSATSPWLSIVTERLSRIRQLIQLKTRGDGPSNDNVSNHGDNNNATMYENDVSSCSDDVSGTKSPQSENMADDRRAASSLCGTSGSHTVTFEKSQVPATSYTKNPHKYTSISPYLNRRYMGAGAGSQHVAESTPETTETTESSGGGEAVSSDDSSMFWLDLDKLGNLFSHQGSRLYVRIGGLAFGLGNVIYISLEIETWLHPDEQCNLLLYDFGWIFILRLVFIVAQTFVMFKGTQVRIVKFQLVSYFGFMHLLSTNICMWLNTLIREIIAVFKSVSFQEANANSSSASTTVAQNTHNITDPCEDSPMLKVSRYLYPFVLEYSLLAIGAIACVLYMGIGPNYNGSPEHQQLTRNFKNLIRVRSYKKRMLKKKGNTSNTSINVGDADANHMSHSSSNSLLAKSHSGVFIGFLLLAGVITCVVLFYFEIGLTDKSRSTQIYLIADIILHGSLLIAGCIATVLTRHLGYIARPLSTDDFLLFLTMSGSLMYETAVIVAAANHFLLHTDSVIGLDMAASILAAGQTVLQTVLILWGMRRYPSTQKDAINMPGRGTFSFLIIGNVAVWIQRTMQVKELTSFDRVQFYGSIAWLLIININLPLLLFFRFHSSVCFADIWNVAYLPLDEDIAAATSNPMTSHPVHSMRPNGRHSSAYDNVSMTSAVNASTMSSIIPHITVTLPSPSEVRRVTLDEEHG